MFELIYVILTVVTRWQYYFKSTLENTIIVSISFQNILAE